MLTQAPTPERLRRIGLGFLASKALLSAVELDVFTALADNPQPRAALEEQLDLHPRASADFLDALVALGVLEREDGVYRNAPDAELYLDRNKETYIGGQFEWANRRMYSMFGNLTQTLRSGKPQSEQSATERTYFDRLYTDSELLEQFVDGMAGMSRHIGEILADSFEWERYETVCDVGAAKGVVPVAIATAHDHIEATVFDLPPLEPVATEFIADSEVEDRVSFHAGNAFEKLPEHDVFVMGRLLHDFDLDRKKQLIQNAYDSLPDGGALLIYGAMIDNERRESEAALLTSLYIRVEKRGFDYTHEQCRTWLEDAGFAETELWELPGRESLVIGRK